MEISGTCASWLALQLTPPSTSCEGTVAKAQYGVPSLSLSLDYGFPRGALESYAVPTYRRWNISSILCEGGHVLHGDSSGLADQEGSSVQAKLVINMRAVESLPR